MRTDDFTGTVRDEEIAAGIRRAEEATSGEIRVFISRYESPSPLEDARREFVRLGMQATPLRNAVLLYFAPTSHRFAVFGDEGIHLRVAPEFWSRTTGEMEALLRAGRFHEAVVLGVERVGAELARYFPKHGIDRNDLPDAVVRD